MKKYAAVIALVLGVGFLATSVHDYSRREKDGRSLTAQEAALFISHVEKLRSHDSRTRLSGIRGLHSFNSLRTMPYLIEALSDSSPEVVTAAVNALLDLKHNIGRTGNRVLVSLCSHPDKRIRRVARRALPRIADWRAVPLFLAEASKPDCNSRVLIFATLEYIAGHSISGDISDKRARTLSDQVEEILSDGEIPDKPLGDEEAGALLEIWRGWYERYKDKTPVDWLLDDIKSGAAPVKATIAALERLKARRAVPVLEGFLKDEDPGIAGAASRALRKLKAQESLPAVIEAVPNVGHRAFREISKTLERFCRRRDVHLLVDIMGKCDGNRFLFVNGLLEKLTASHSPVERGEMLSGKKEVLEFWRKETQRSARLTDLELWAGALESETPRDRVYALKNLASLGDAAVPHLIDAMEDDAEAVRRIAERQLRKITRYYFDFDPLAPEDERAQTVREVRKWWGRVKHVDAFDRFVSTMQDRCESVRHRADATAGLKELDDWRAVPHLIAALEEKPAGLRYYAAVALRGIVGRTFEDENGGDDFGGNQVPAKWRRWWEIYRGKTKEFVFMSTIADMRESEGEKIEAIKRLVIIHSSNAIPNLVNLLCDESFLVSVAAEQALEKICGKTYFYSLEGPKSDRAAIQKKWRTATASGVEVSSR